MAANCLKNVCDVAGSQEYTEWDPAYQTYDQKERVYFIDSYSKTFPTEDRAVLLGTLMEGEQGDDLFKCPHITDKLLYYFRAIRACFDPNGQLWREPTYWEQRLTMLNNIANDAA